MNIYQINQKNFDSPQGEVCSVKKLVHDIRSPLQTLAIIASGHFNGDSRKDELTKQCVKRINELTQKNIKHQSQINLPNFLSKLSHQKQVELGLKLQTEIKAHNHVVSVNISETALMESLSNLINNSFNSRGCTRIRIKVSMTAEMLNIAIIDNGEGIEEDKLDLIGQYGNSFTKNGSGIGLASCISSIKQAGGSVKCQSIFKHGTKMTMILPTNKT